MDTRVGILEISPIPPLPHTIYLPSQSISQAFIGFGSLGRREWLRALKVMSTHRTYNSLYLTHAAQARIGGRQRFKCSPMKRSWIYLISTDWTSKTSPGPGHGSGIALRTSAGNGGVSFPCRHVVWSWASSVITEHPSKPSKVFWIPGQPCPYMHDSKDRTGQLCR